MPSQQGRLPRLVIVWIDVLAYAVTVAALATIAALTVSVATGGWLVRSKILLFVVGWVLLGYATIRLWPSSPEALETDESVAGRSIAADVDTTRVQRIARALPPARWIRQPLPDERVSQGGKLFVAACAVLLTSFLMESVFGVV